MAACFVANDNQQTFICPELIWIGSPASKEMGIQARDLSNYAAQPIWFWMFLKVANIMMQDSQTVCPFGIVQTIWRLTADYEGARNEVNTQ